MTGFKHSRIQSLVGPGWIGPIHCAGYEILRRLLVTVRDRNWQEVSPTQFHNVVDEGRGSVTLSARHTSGLVDFEWTGELIVSHDCSNVRFAMKGRALRDMEVCRLGLIVLHPVQTMVGARVTAASEGGEQQIEVSQRLAPQPIINGLPGAMTEPFDVLRIEREGFATLQLSFTGELFELEDQRNWGDASFKTYCTPLRRGFPRKVSAGTTIEHAVAVSFEPSSPPSPSRLQVKDTVPIQTRSLPEIGRVWNADAPMDAMRGWDYLHLDLSTVATNDPDGTATIALLQRSLLAAPESKFELALGEGAEQVAAQLAPVLVTNRARIARVLVYADETGEKTASLARWLSAPQLGGQAIAVFAAVRGYFVEFNRAPGHAAAQTTGQAGIAFPLSATVHSDDLETVMSNVGTIRDMATTARELFGAVNIALAPLALYYPRRPEAPERLDAPQVLRWLSATLSNVVAAGITSVTITDDVLSAYGATPVADRARAIRALLIESQSG